MVGLESCKSLSSIAITYGLPSLSSKFKVLSGLGAIFV